MKKIILMVLFTLSLGVATMMGQAKKPTIMVVPSDAWCNADNRIRIGGRLFWPLFTQKQL